MLIYSEARYLPSELNMITLKCGDGYLYIHRSLYDQIVVINDIYSTSKEMLIEHLTGKSESRGDVDWFWDNIPSPVNVMAPFLLLVKSELEDFVDMIGAIHAMSGPVALRGLLRVPFEMRNTPSFSLSIKEEYQLSWERFFMLSTPFDQISIGGPVQMVAAPAQQMVAAPAQAVTSDVSDDGEDWAALQRDTSGPNGGPSLKIGIYIPDGENQIRKIGDKYYNLENEVFDNEDDAIVNGINWDLQWEDQKKEEEKKEEGGDSSPSPAAPVSTYVPEPVTPTVTVEPEPEPEPEVTEPVSEAPLTGLDLLMKGDL